MTTHISRSAYAHGRIDTTWMDHAACTGKDPDLWFPDTRGRTLKDTKTGALALLICQTQCPVQEQCARYAKHHDLEYGIYGGQTATERRRG